MRFSTLDLAIVGVYFVFIFGLAQWLSRDRGEGPKTSTDYFLASKKLPWWAIGTSLIAANISAEQIVGMSGSGYAIGLAIASYEWMAALTLLVVGKFFLPIFLKNGIHTMPQFLEQRYGPSIRTLMAVFWVGLYVFVNLTSIIWLGSIAVSQVSSLDQDVALYGLAAFALLYQLRGGLKAVALTDVVQVTLLVFGGLTISAMTLSQIGEGSILAGAGRLMRAAPGHFEMILHSDNPFYRDLPGISVIVGGMWIANLAYWGFNQYIIQRALAARSLAEAQKGVMLAAYLKLLMPFIIVLPGIAAVVLAPGLDKPDQAYPTMMRLLPPGLLGLVFAALTAAIIASAASKINAIGTIVALDLFGRRRARPDAVTGASSAHQGTAAEDRRLVLAGRVTAVIATLVAAATARPLLGGADQAFQFIQEYTGFFTPGITVIFLLGLFWRRASEAGALVGAVGSLLLSIMLARIWPSLPFMDRWLVVFVLALGATVAVSLIVPQRRAITVDVENVSYASARSFNVGSAGVILILIALYAAFW
ncbi:sodium/solute symporter [Sphingomonas sp. RRHST34]|uniref:Sodium/solute symporter n=1 Tax=Sphingomonas citri TaxID=2862499 RepID=A0ABS7BSD7_9SPHN|nr:sodium/solute symporter [Sphingomonas citri]MBW6532510.1 sodium/solute symporter [Sphingomonas citri]